ncbi:Fructose-bisphosphate aldolase 1 [Rhodotorula kratochvilovae]
MNVDTDTQWAYMSGQDYLKSQVGNPDGADKPNKKYADPRVWVREGELTMKKRCQEAFHDLLSEGKL